MFGFANFLLLALFAAAVFDLIFALARGGGLRGALHGLWSTPHLLFGQQLAEWRLQLGRILFAAGLAAYEISVVFCNSMARQNWAWVQGVMSPVLEWLAFLCFGAKILFGTRYTWRELLAGGALYFIARWVDFNSQNIWWIGIVVAVLAAKDVPLRRPLQVYFASGCAAMAVVLALHFAGIVAPDLTSERMGALRGTYGYGHPNTFGGLVFGPVLAYALLRAPKRCAGWTACWYLPSACFCWWGPPAAALRCARWRWPLGWCVLPPARRAQCTPLVARHLRRYGGAYGGGQLPFAAAGHQGGTVEQ